MIVIIDYKMGNVGSIHNMLKKIGAESMISDSPDEIRKADRLILPGVGAFDHGMFQLRQSRFFDVLQEEVLHRKTPILGICLGMQLFTERSEEGGQTGLGWIKGETVRFRFEPNETRRKVPHMGWDTLTPRRTDSLFRGLDKEARFYFVHSYHVRCKSEDDILATTHYGFNFTSAIQRGHIIGTQFHPEKSHKYGMTVLKNFSNLKMITPEE